MASSISYMNGSNFEGREIWHCIDPKLPSCVWRWSLVSTAAVWNAVTCGWTVLKESTRLLKCTNWHVFEEAEEGRRLRLVAEPERARRLIFPLSWCPSGHMNDLESCELYRDRESPSIFVGDRLENIRIYRRFRVWLVPVREHTIWHDMTWTLKIIQRDCDENRGWQDEGH